MAGNLAPPVSRSCDGDHKMLLFTDPLRERLAGLREAPRGTGSRSFCAEPWLSSVLGLTRSSYDLAELFAEGRRIKLGDLPAIHPEQGRLIQAHRFVWDKRRT